MAKLTIDLTGKNGLMDNFFGDYDNLPNTPAKIIGQPNRRYSDSNSGFMAAGIYNPFKRNGYLSPADLTLANIQQATSSVNTVQSASIYDDVNDDLYFLESILNSSNIRLLKGDGFEDVDFSNDRSYPSVSTGNDLEIYTIYGERTLFVSLTSSTTTRLHTRNLNYDLTTETFTAVAGTDIITLTKSNNNYTIVNDMIVAFTSSTTLPAGLVAGTNYYVIGAADAGSSATFQVSATSGGAAVDITDTGTGTHYLSPYKNSMSTLFQNGFDMSVNGMTKMIVSGDGFMYILNANKVHRFDGTTIGGVRGTIHNNILTAPDYFRFTGGMDYKNNLYLLIHKNTSYGVNSLNTKRANSECGVYIWNRQASFFNTSQFIPVLGAREIRRIWVNESDEIMIMIVGSDGYTELRKYNGTNFVTIKKLPKYSEVRYDDSLVVTNNGTTWLANDGHIYSYGKAPGSDKKGLFVIGDTCSAKTGNFITPGAILYGSTDTNLNESLILSYSDSNSSPSNLLKKFYFNGVAGAGVNACRGDIFTPVINLPYMSTLNHIDIYCNVTATSGTTYQGKINFYKNQQTTAFMTKYVTRDDLVKGYISYELNVPYANSIQIEIEYFNSASTPPSGSTPQNGDDDFSPYVAILTYEPTNTTKASS